MSEKQPGRSKGRSTYRPDDHESKPPPPSQEVVEQLLRNAGNGSGEGEPPPHEDTLSPTASELKAAVKTVTVETSGSHKALNPSAPEFTPATSTSSTPLNPNSTEFTPLGVTLPTKQLPQSSSLDPNCPEFVPGFKSPWNVDATEFVPKTGLPVSMQNGDIGMGLDELDNREEIKNLIPQEEEIPVLEAQDIVEKFERVAKVSAEDQEGCNQLLNATAEMLLKATMYPGSFDRLKLNIAATIGKWPPVSATLQNLAEMIIHWGISEPSLRYTAGRVAQEVCSALGDQAMGFMKPLFIRLQSWYKVWINQYESESTLTEDKKYRFINLALFYAEVLVRVRTGETPFKGLVKAIFDFVKKLLELKEDTTVITACHILKLTGFYLENAEDKSSSENMEKIVTQLKNLSTDTSLSSKSTDLVVRVVQMQSEWSKSGDTEHTPSQQAIAVATVASNLNTDAPVFVPSGEIEFYYQQPVRNAEEWSEYFEGDDDTDADLTDQPDFDIEVDDEGLDSEIELEMEAFIEEIEEHLMMRDFDPDLEYSQQ